jgi:hypothetical protein
VGGRWTVCWPVSLSTKRDEGIRPDFFKPLFQTIPKIPSQRLSSSIFSSPSIAASGNFKSISDPVFGSDSW